MSEAESRAGDATRLAATQHLLAGALTSPSADLPASMLDAIVPGGTLDAAGALGVYRRSYIARLTEQLGETYASVWRVMGDEEFFDLCRAYIAGHASDSYNLSDYGRHFPGFLAGTAGLPAFLEELARFELEVRDLFHLRAHVPIDAATLAEIGDLSGVRFRFGAATKLVACESAVYDVFRHRHNPEPPDLDFERPQYLLLFREGGDVLAREVDAATFAALERLAAGRPVEDALEAAVARDPDFGPEQAAWLFEILARCGLVEAITQPA